MPAKRLAITMPDDVAGDVEKAAATGANGNVSAWLTQAAMDRLAHERRLAAGHEALAWFEAQHGPITAEELAEARRTLGWDKSET